MTVREKTEELESKLLAPYATLSKNSRGRARPQPQCDLRTVFQRDRDRIIHSKSFRRLRHKTQVFLAPEGDHYRTRLTHTLEVSQIARTIARALRLNEDLVEAISLGHDLGHTPFGHAGEMILNEVCPFGFRHNEQSLRVADCLERDRAGLNLTEEVRDGILCHTGKQEAFTPEGRLIRFADRIAYTNHDIDDAIRAGILTEDMLPKESRDVLGRGNSERISTMIRGVIAASHDGVIDMEDGIKKASMLLRDFMFEHVYKNSKAKTEESKAKEILMRMYEYFLQNPKRMPEEFYSQIDREGIHRVVCDYIAGMTDNYAIAIFEELFVPKTWKL